MKENLKRSSNAALAMYYYAYLNERDVVEAVVSLPSLISLSNYIQIPTNDQSLVGKKYNRVTGEFEDIMFYYAVLDERDLVIEVVALESQVTEDNKIEIPTYDQSLVGKWYDRESGIFSAPPIHILAKMNTGEINTLNADGTPADKWLQTELSELGSNLTAINTDLNGKISTVDTTLKANITAVDTALNTNLTSKILNIEMGAFGGYKTTFTIRDNQEILSDWVDNGKRHTFTFDTGIPGYFPKMFRLTDKSSTNELFVSDFYIIKNTDGTVKRSYLDFDYVGSIKDSGRDAEERIVRHDVNMHSTSAFTSGYDNGKIYNEGGHYFVSNIPSREGATVYIGDFTYNETSFSFTISTSSEMVGKYSSMNFTAYVY